MTKSKWWGLILVLMIGVGVMTWRLKPAKPQFESIPVTRQTLSQTIKVPGTVVPLNRVQVFPPVAGRVESTLVQEGDYVEAGAVLAIMSSFERATILDAARSESPEKLQYWQKVYQPTKLFAPISGKIIVKNINVGQTVASSTELFVIADQLMIKAQVDETDLAKIRVNMPAHVTLDTYPDKPVSGKITHISYESIVINNVSVYYIQIRLDRIPPYFLSGMSASIVINYREKKNVLTLPDRALQQEGDTTTVLMQTPHHEGFSRHEVIIGTQANGFTEILSGLAEQDKVVILISQETKRKSGLYPFNQKR